MSPSARNRLLAYGGGSVMLIAQMLVLWPFVDGCWAEYTQLDGVTFPDLISRFDWLKAPLWHKRWMVGYGAVTLGLGIAVTLGLVVIAILRSKHHDEART